MFYQVILSFFRSTVATAAQHVIPAAFVPLTYPVTCADHSSLRTAAFPVNQRLGFIHNLLMGNGWPCISQSLFSIACFFMVDVCLLWRATTITQPDSIMVMLQKRDLLQDYQQALNAYQHCNQRLCGRICCFLLCLMNKYVTTMRHQTL